jgi:hypothetical protein
VPNPVFGDPRIGAGFEDLSQSASLQAGFGSFRGFGKWTRYRLNERNIRMSTTAGTITVPGDAGSISLCHLGDTMLCSLDSHSPLVVAGAGTSPAILIRLPDGYGYRPRNSLGEGDLNFRHTGQLVTRDSAGTNTGSIFEIGSRYGANILAIFKDVLGTGWPNGNVYLYGQTFWENFPDGEQ